MAGKVAPAPVAKAVAAFMCGHMRRQLHARGMARHSDEIIAAKGKADVDAVETLLGDRAFLLGDRPSMADVSAYGLLMPMAKWPMRTPVADYIKTRATLLGYLGRVADAKAERTLAA